MEKLNEPGGGKSLSPGDMRNCGPWWLCMLPSMSSSCGELKYFNLWVHSYPLPTLKIHQARNQLHFETDHASDFFNLPQRSFHVISIARVHVDDWIVAVFIIRVDAVAHKFHRFSFDIVWGSCGWGWRQAFLIRRWSQASAAVAIGRQVDCVLQVVVII